MKYTVIFPILQMIYKEFLRDLLVKAVEEHGEEKYYDEILRVCDFLLGHQE